MMKGGSAMQGRWLKQKSGRRRIARRSRRKRILMIAGAVLCAGIAVFSAVQLIAYGRDYLASRQAAEELRQAYYAQDATASPAIASAAPTASSAPAADTPLPQVTQTAAASPTPALVLPDVTYPGNELALTTSRFKKLRRQNEDIVGWLNIPELIDEAVVQRDNEYYLRRDYRGYHNTNGAIFMDESIKLKTRPYTLILYGHNMKTGAMFGNLRHYENLTYYKNSPFITFDSMYEEGRYVIFAASVIGTNRTDWNFINVDKLNSTTIAWRKEEIRRLRAHSAFSSPIDVQPEDQLLLLITCVDKETERRIVAARRIRPGETEAQLLRQVQRSQLQ